MAANLTTVAVGTRKIIRFGLAGVIILLIGRAVLLFGISIYKQTVPKPPPPPSVGFGTLPQINFPSKAEVSDITYKLETPSGTFPAFPTQMPVYFIPASSTGLFAYDRMVSRAISLGFTNDPVQVNTNLYHFTHTSLPATLDSDIVSGSFSLSFNLAADASALKGVAPDEVTAANRIKDALGSAKIPNEELSGTPQIEYLRVEGNNLVHAVSRSEAQFTQVSLYRAPIVLGDPGKEVSFPSKTGDTKHSNVWFIVSSAGGVKQLIAGEYKHFPLSTDKVETYPIKTAAQAFEELKAGGGYIANLGLQRTGEIPIRRVYLAYYDPPTPGVFYQPIVVFEGGDNEFVAYISAIATEYYEQKAPEGN